MDGCSSKRQQQSSESMPWVWEHHTVQRTWAPGFSSGSLAHGLGAQLRAQAPLQARREHAAWLEKLLALVLRAVAPGQQLPVQYEVQAPGGLVAWALAAVYTQRQLLFRLHEQADGALCADIRRCVFYGAGVLPCECDGAQMIC
jgi:hypothetical protein